MESVPLEVMVTIAAAQAEAIVVALVMEGMRHGTWLQHRGLGQEGSREQVGKAKAKERAREAAEGPATDTTGSGIPIVGLCSMLLPAFNLPLMSLSLANIIQPQCPYPDPSVGAVLCDVPSFSFVIYLTWILRFYASTGMALPLQTAVPPCLLSRAFGNLNETRNHTGQERPLPPATVPYSMQQTQVHAQ